MADGDLWLLTDAGASGKKKMLTEVSGGSWTGANQKIPEAAIDKIDLSSRGVVKSSLLSAVANGHLLSDNGDPYDNVASCIDDSTEWMFVPPGEYHASGEIADVPSSKGKFAIFGVHHHRSIIHGDDDTALQWDARNGLLHHVQLKTNVGQGGTAHGGLFNGKDMTIRNGAVWYANNSGYKINANDWHLDGIHVDSAQGNVLGIGVWVAGSGVKGFASRVDVNGPDNHGIFLDGVSRTMWVLAGARNCTDEGIEISGSTENTGMFGVTGWQNSGTADYQDKGTNNVAMGIVGSKDVSSATTPKDGNLYTTI